MKIKILTFCNFILFLTTTYAYSQTYGSFTDTRDGHVYKTVKIGNQTWFAENLAYLPQVFPPESGNAKESLTKPFYYVAYYKGSDVSEAKQSKYFKEYGVLYNWVAAKKACPPGWHLPTDEEWKTLERFMGMPEAKINEQFREEGKVGYQLKSKNQWSDPGPDKYGFGALPGGFRFPTTGGGVADFGYVDKQAFWWTATISRDDLAWRRQIIGGMQGIVRFAQGIEQGYSVRCIKDLD